MTIPRNKVTCLLGPNGAGKTTLIKILSALITPDCGTVEFNGMPRDARNTLIRSKIGLATPNERSFYMRLSGRQNLAFFGSLYSLKGRELEERVQEALEETGLIDGADKPYRLYSTGMKQKLNIARTLLGRPELYLLDEPAAHLDPFAREDFLKFVADGLVRRRGATVLMCTHDLEEARRISEYLVILNEGRIVAEGSPQDLLGKNLEGSCLEMHYGGAAPASWIAAFDGFVSLLEPGCLRLALGIPGVSQEEAIRAFVEAGGALSEAYLVKTGLFEFLRGKLSEDR